MKRSEFSTAQSVRVKAEMTGDLTVSQRISPTFPENFKVKVQEDVIPTLARVHDDSVHQDYGI